MSQIHGNGVVHWTHPKFARCVATWDAVRRLDDAFPALLGLKLWREVLQVLDDPGVDIEKSVAWLEHRSWGNGRHVQDIFDAWRAGQAAREST